MASMDALIGHTGFVGGTLDRSGWDFGARFNSRNIDDMRGRHFSTIVCAGVSAVKWKANKEPEADWAGIQRLVEVLDTVTADRFVLVSTVDIYPTPIGVTEDDSPPRGTGQPYGRHRLDLEHHIAERFPVHHTIRLPALFGQGLKKNAIFDLLTGNLVDKISPNGVFQWYPMIRFADDVKRVMAAGLPVLNIAVAPLRMGDIAERLFPGVAIGPADMPAGRYDMWTRHAAVLGGSGHYHLDADAAFTAIADYVAWVRSNGGTP